LGGFGGYYFERAIARKSDPSDTTCRVISGGETPPFLALYGLGLVGSVFLNRRMRRLRWPLWARVVGIAAGAVCLEAIVGYASRAMNGGEQTWDYRQGPGLVSRFTACDGMICLEAALAWLVLGLLLQLFY
jgi:hypothetical protein